MIRILKKIACSLLLVLGLVWLGRGPIFRLLFSYKTDAAKNIYLIENQGLISKLEADFQPTDDPEKIIQQALQLTADELHFSFKKCSNDPNQLIENPSANCIGYAAFFCSTSRFLFQKAGFADEIEIEHRRGRLFLGGVDLCSFSKNQFWENHDFVSVHNRRTGQTWGIDPSLFDYSGIESINIVQ